MSGKPAVEFEDVLTQEGIELKYWIESEVIVSFTLSKSNQELTICDHDHPGRTSISPRELLFVHDNDHQIILREVCSELRGVKVEIPREFLGLALKPKYQFTFPRNMRHIEKQSCDKLVTTCDD